MWRDCTRVLKQWGRIAGYIIHTPAGLSEFERIRAEELGPSDVSSPSPIEDLTHAAGLTIIARKDVTELFRATCTAILEARKRLEVELRRDEGKDLYEEEQDKKHLMLTGIDEGLLRRSLFVAHKP